MGPEDIFGPPPPGIDLTANYSDTIWAPIIVVIILTIITFALRFIAKRLSKDPYMKPDDYWLILGMIISIGSATCAFEAVKHGSGKHIWALKPDDITSLLKIIYADGLIYSTAVTCTKMSILLYYRRIFNFKYVYYFGLFLIISYWVTVIIVLNAGCRPLSLIWEQYTNPLLLKTGVCMDLPKFYWQNAIWAMVVDIVILLMPIYPVWTLHTTVANKMAVTGMLALGVFVIGACGARIEAMHHLMTEIDQSWYLCPAFAWTCVEPFVGIISACLPTLGPLVQHTQKSSCLGIFRRKTLTESSFGTCNDTRSYQKHVPKDELSAYSPCSSDTPYSPRNAAPKPVPKDESAVYSPQSSSFCNSPRSVPVPSSPRSPSFFYPRSPGYPYSPRSPGYPYSPRSPGYPRSPRSPRSPGYPYSIHSPRSSPSLYTEEHELNTVNHHSRRNRPVKEEDEEEFACVVDITHEIIGPDRV